jgi:hypothetical protein
MDLGPFGGDTRELVDVLVKHLEQTSFPHSKNQVKCCCITTNYLSGEKEECYDQLLGLQTVGIWF